MTLIMVAQDEFVFRTSKFASYGPELSEYVEPPSLSKMIIIIIRVIPQLYLVSILLSSYI